MANKMGIIHHFLIKIETEGKTITNYKLQITNYKLQITNYPLPIINYPLIRPRLWLGRSSLL